MTRLHTVRLSELIIDDEASFAHVGLYGELRDIVAASEHRFAVLQRSVRRATWDRALFLNLTFWHAAEPTEVLVDEHIPADVVAHVAWHLLASRHLAADGGRLGPEALLLSEAIASAFDLYLVGRLLGHRPDADFLQTQVPAMQECAVGAGMDDDEFANMLETVASDPERAFEDLRALLFDASLALYGCGDVESAASALERLEDRRFAPLLHHYELSNWTLYARAYGGGSPDRDARGESAEAVAPSGGDRAQGLDRSLRAAPVALDWLAQHWVQPALVHTPEHPHRRARPRKVLP